MTNRSIHRAVTLAALGVSLGVTSELPAQTTKLKQTLKFAAEMAKQGNWREARFRWEQAASRQPDNPRILNNLAVASEVLGDAEAASSYYNRALSLSGRDPRIDENSERFRRFRRLARESERGHESAPPEDLDAEPAAPASKKAGKKAIRVVARFSLPARLDLEGFENILVASFLTEETGLLDTNREVTRFLRSEFRKRSSLDVLDVTPPPAIPEQTIEDLLANHEFWRHLGRQYGADLIVSGVVNYNRRDSSGFQDVDVISPVTGHKVRQTRYVEQEQFTYSMEVFFIDGETGTLHFRDRLQHSNTYAGTSNDPLTAFYGLVEAIARDVLAVVSPRVREDIRIVFRS